MVEITCGESVLVALKSTFDTNAEAGSTYSISNTPNEPTLPTYSKLRETTPNPNFKWLHKVTPTQNFRKNPIQISDIQLPVKISFFFRKFFGDKMVTSSTHW